MRRGVKLLELKLFYLVGNAVHQIESPISDETISVL